MLIIMLSFNNNYILFSLWCVCMPLHSVDPWQQSHQSASWSGYLEKLADTQSCYFGLRIAGCQLWRLEDCSCTFRKVQSMPCCQASLPRKGIVDSWRFERLGIQGIRDSSHSRNACLSSGFTEGCKGNAPEIVFHLTMIVSYFHFYNPEKQGKKI